MEYVSPKPVSLRNHPLYSERWVQARIVENPSLLGLGDVDVLAEERRQPAQGRLDLLLADDSGTRYEVEIQLGSTDESHIIRTIEYWDYEKRRYPNYQHCAVIVAEDITTRFLNVLALFNGFIPLIAIQLRAFEVNGALTLIPITVMNKLDLGTDDEDAGETTDRAYWEQKASKATVKLAEDVLLLVREVTGQPLSLKFNKFYIGLAREGVPNNFVHMRPRKKHMLISFKMARTDEWDQKFEESGFELLDYQARWGNYRIRVEDTDLVKGEDFLRDFIAGAYKASGK